MPHSTALADLYRMSPVEREEAMHELINRSRGPVRNLEIEARIRAFERRYEMTSRELLRALRAGEQRETSDISEWLFWLQALGRGD